MAVDYAAIWNELNPRQQFYLKTIFDEDQEREASQRKAKAQGNWDSRPAAEWRAIDAYHDPASPRDLVGITALQGRWSAAGHHDQGTGSTLKVLDLVARDRAVLGGVVDGDAVVADIADDVARDREVGRAFVGEESGDPDAVEGAVLERVADTADLDALSADWRT
ncbi:hypothetical protein [Streptomyces sp. NBC_01669]|uniref:hypothetical protein n=1 Tax=Streptomyces sp. NBC_01669 TaxID=2975909 RepID=UPI00225B5394|nr:hypothetical protein [Streptomyces sp. NBC_01669]MCX4538325.1 hypothetical protein [Streptomyces sp. NBC_01669]